MQLRKTEVLIIGAGNAGLCAALTASQQGRKVLIIEKAPMQYRGGNSSLTMNFRFPHSNVNELLDLLDLNSSSNEDIRRLRERYQPYSEEEFNSDLLRISGNKADHVLVGKLAEKAKETISWLRKLGHTWEVKPRILPGSLPVRLRGSGRELMDLNFLLAERAGIEIIYSATLQSFEAENQKVVGAYFISPNGRTYCRAESFILASGGFQGSNDLREKFLGTQWIDTPLRGVPFNTGDGLIAAVGIGAAKTGDYSHAHTSPQDIDIPKFVLPGQNKLSQSNSRYCFNFGITINLFGQRFFDEGEDYPNFLYAKIGRLIQDQPKKIAFQIFDSRSIQHVSAGYFESGNMGCSSNLSDLAAHFEIDQTGLETTVNDYNFSAFRGKIDHNKFDGASTIALTIPKSNWASPLEEPPFYLAPVRGGITFTFGGLSINESAQVLSVNGAAFSNLYAAGEIVGGLFYGNYAGGSGLMSGSTFGRIAGLCIGQP